MAWNRPSEDKTKTKVRGEQRNVHLKGLVAGAVGVVIAVSVAVWIALDDTPRDTPRVHVAAKKPATVKHVQAPRSPDAANANAPTSAAERIKAEINEKTREFITKSPTNLIVWIGEKELDPADPDNALRTRTAKAVASILAVPPGEHFPEFMTLDFILGGETGSSDGGNKAFLDSLKKWQVALKDDDSDDRVAFKQSLFDSQLELIKDIDAGGTVNDSIRAAYEYRVKAAEFRDSVVEMIKTMHSEDGDLKTTRKLIAEANRKLADKGFVLIDEHHIFTEEELDAEADSAEQDTTIDQSKEENQTK